MSVLTLMFTATAQECQVGGTNKSCDFRPDITVKEGLVIGSATARCTVPPNIHDFTLTMQLLDNHAEWKFGVRMAAPRFRDPAVRSR